MSFYKRVTAKNQHGSYYNRKLNRQTIKRHITVLVKDADGQHELIQALLCGCITFIQVLVIKYQKVMSSCHDPAYGKVNQVYNRNLTQQQRSNS